jgi:hypothetical protein
MSDRRTQPFASTPGARDLARALLARARIMARQVFEEASRDGGTAGVRPGRPADAARLLAAADRLSEAWRAAAEEAARRRPAAGAAGRPGILARRPPAPDGLACHGAAAPASPIQPAHAC